jgi:hypothetical protein
MDALRENPLLLYLLILWAVVTTILLVLFVWRAFLEGHEDDQVFIGSAENHLAQEQRMLVAKIDRLSKPIHYLMFVSGGLFVIGVVAWLWSVLKTF